MRIFRARLAGFEILVSRDFLPPFLADFLG